MGDPRNHADDAYAAFMYEVTVRVPASITVVQDHDTRVMWWQLTGSTDDMMIFARTIYDTIEGKQHDDSVHD